MTLRVVNYAYNIINVHIAHSDCKAFALCMLFCYATSDLWSAFVCIYVYSMCLCMSVSVFV